MTEQPCKWENIKTWCIRQLHLPGTNLGRVADKDGVTVYWLMRLKSGTMVDPGWSKVGRLFAVLGGKVPKVPSDTP